MAQLGRIDFSVTNGSGTAVTDASVQIRKQGATIDGAQSGSSPLTVTVNSPGALANGDSIDVYRTGTTLVRSGSVSAVPTATAVQITFTGGSVTLNDEDRISASDNLPTLQNDSVSGETKSNPLSANSDGQVFAWIRGGFYDRRISGTGITTKLFEDLQVTAEDTVSNIFGTGTNDAFIKDTNLALATGDLHTSYRVQGTEIFDIRETGVFRATGASQITTGGLIIDASGITITAGGILNDEGTITSSVADGASAVAHILNTDEAYTSTASLLNLRNNGSNRFSFQQDGALLGNRYHSSRGTLLVAGDFALSAGWGTTATVSNVLGRDGASFFRVNSLGTGQLANPTIVITFTDGSWGSNTPIPFAGRVSSTGQSDQPEVIIVPTAITPTVLTLIFRGTPVAAEEYGISFHMVGMG